MYHVTKIHSSPGRTCGQGAVVLGRPRGRRPRDLGRSRSVFEGAVADARPDGDLHRVRGQGAVGPPQRDLHVVDPRAAELVFGAEAPLDLGPGLVGGAIGLVDALAPVAPLPFQLGAVELLDVVAA